MITLPTRLETAVFTHGAGAKAFCDHMVRQARVQHPDLCPHGLYLPSGRPETEQSFEGDEAMLLTALAFMRGLTPIRRVNVGSYRLKHIAESWGARHGLAPYIHNGGLIVAAVYLNFPTKLRSLNLDIAVSLRSLDALSREANRQRVIAYFKGTAQ